MIAKLPPELQDECVRQDAENCGEWAAAHCRDRAQLETLCAHWKHVPGFLEGFYRGMGVRQ